MFSNKKLKAANDDFDEDAKLCQIRHDIRNMKRLTPHQNEYIQCLSHAKKLYIISLYDEMMDWFVHFTENL